MVGSPLYHTTPLCFKAFNTWLFPIHGISPKWSVDGFPMEFIQNTFRSLGYLLFFSKGNPTTGIHMDSYHDHVIHLIIHRQGPSRASSKWPSVSLFSPPARAHVASQRWPFLTGCSSMSLSLELPPVTWQRPRFYRTEDRMDSIYLYI